MVLLSVVLLSSVMLSVVALALPVMCDKLLRLHTQIIFC
jgi:hypothetical protein